MQMFKKFLLVILIVTSFNYISAALASPYIHANHGEGILYSNIVLIENSSKASAIINAIKDGSSECINVSSSDRTSCVAGVLKKASRKAIEVRFGVGKTMRALARASRKMRRLPDDGSNKSLSQGRDIIRSLSKEIERIANTRPPRFRSYQLQVSVSVLKLIRPLKKGRG